MRVRLVVFMLGATLLAAPAAAAAAPKISLDANKRLVVYKQHAQLAGRLSTGRAGRTVLIKADQFPYGKSRTVARAKTRRGGRFAVRVRPNLNTNYRAVLKQANPTVSSQRARVAVLPRGHSRCNYCSKAPRHAGNYKLRSTSTFLFPTKSAARSNAKKPFFFYYGARKGSKPPSRLKLRKRVRSHYLGGRKVRTKVVYTFHRPRSAYVSVVQGCVKDSPREDGIGLPGDHHCGDKTISRNLSYLGRSGSAAATRLP